MRKMRMERRRKKRWRRKKKKDDEEGAEVAENLTKELRD